MRYRLVLPLFALFVFAACEASLDAPDEAALSLRTRTATEVLPADARYVGKIDLQAVQQNAHLDPFQEGPINLDNASGEAAARLQSFLDATGFDPQTDLREVYVAIEEQNDVSTPSLAIYAALDRARIADYVDGELADAFRKEDYRGVPFYTTREQDEQMTFALANDELIVASPSADVVRAMVDRLADGGRALKDDDGAMQLVRSASAGDAWFVVRSIDAHTTTGTSEMDAFGSAVQDVALSVRTVADGVEGDVVMNARAGVSADDLARLTKGAVAAMKSAAQDEAGVRALDNVRVQADGDVVRVDFSLDNATIAAIRTATD